MGSHMNIRINRIQCNCWKVWLEKANGLEKYLLRSNESDDKEI